MKPTKVTAETERRERLSRAIAKSIVSLHEKREYPPELVFEGAIRGAAALLMAKGRSPGEVAVLLEQASQSIADTDLSDLDPTAH